MAKLWTIIFGTILLTDLVILNIFIYRLYRRPLPVIVNNPPVVTQQITDACGPECQKYIDSKIIAFPTASPSPIKVVIPTHTKVRTISYLPVPGSNSTTANNWADLSGTDFYFDPHDYSGLISIYFETNLHLFNGNGLAFVRLFDVTHGVGVQGSEVQTSKQADTAVESGQVSFYAGKNLIRVQAKSLTADTTVFTSGRLKITTEN